MRARRIQCPSGSGSCHGQMTGDEIPTVWLGVSFPREAHDSILRNSTEGRMFQGSWYKPYYPIYRTRIINNRRVVSKPAKFWTAILLTFFPKIKFIPMNASYPTHSYNVPNKIIFEFVIVDGSRSMQDINNLAHDMPLAVSICHKLFYLN